MKNSIVSFVAAAAITLGSGCDIDDSASDIEVLDEDLGIAAQEIIYNVDDCATSGPNAETLISLPGTGGVYVRDGFNMNGGCGADTRVTTYFDSHTSSFNTHRYRLRAYGDLGPAGTNKTSCERMQMRTRLQKEVGGSFVDISLVDSFGIWFAGTVCIPPPGFDVTRLNKSGSAVETTTYRLRAYAVKANGDYAKITMHTHNEGP